MNGQKLVLRIKKIRNLQEMEQICWDDWDILFLETIKKQRDKKRLTTKIFTLGNKNELLPYALNLFCGFSFEYYLKNPDRCCLLANCSAEEVITTIKIKWPELSGCISYFC